MLTVIALDPGGTTGWSMFRAEVMPTPDGEELFNARWSQGQLGPHEHHDQLYGFLELQQTMQTYVICEGFEYRNRARAGLVLVSKEYIGVAKLFCIRNKVSYGEQTAAQGKGFVKDANIKKLGMWMPGKPHANDATRHLLWWLINAAPVSIKDNLREPLLEKGWK